MGQLHRFIIYFVEFVLSGLIDHPCLLFLLVNKETLVLLGHQNGRIYLLRCWNRIFNGSSFIPGTIVKWRANHGRNRFAICVIESFCDWKGDHVLSFEFLDNVLFAVLAPTLSFKKFRTITGLIYLEICQISRLKSISRILNRLNLSRLIKDAIWCYFINCVGFLSRILGIVYDDTGQQSFVCLFIIRTAFLLPERILLVKNVCISRSICRVIQIWLQLVFDVARSERHFPIWFGLFLPKILDWIVLSNRIE